MEPSRNRSSRSIAGAYNERGSGYHSGIPRATYAFSTTPATLRLIPILLCVLAFLTTECQAAFMTFENCLGENFVDSQPRYLQFTPLNVTAFFNTSAPSHNLNITIYGNVSGLTTDQPYPPPDSPVWANRSDTLGKIIDLSDSTNKYSTLLTEFNVLTYQPYYAASRFCTSTVQGECPLGPVFYTNSSDLASLRAFSVAHELYSSYAFTSMDVVMKIISAEAGGAVIGCASVCVTPDLGGYLRGLLTYLPVAVLVVVGLATICASILSPWGSSDTFRWTSNYGRDEDLLRLVTPGFGDCLHYIQFIILTGSLSLNYPGFYQPVVSNIGWSSLMFNESIVTHGNGTQSLVDGLYQYRTNSTYGLDKMSQLIGMTSIRDMWADMFVWLVTLVAGVALLTQVGFALRWLYRQVAHVPEEDLRSKNLPFTAGNIVRIVLNYFLLPLISLSMFQLVMAPQGPSYSVALAAIVIVCIVAFCVRLTYLFARIRPRSFLFDDLPTLLAYGPIYNTYSDNAATFSLVPIFLNLLRGIAIGAVQASGIAQIVLLAICEIIFVLTLNAFRPFPPATSMNIYHTFFASVRLVTILLSVAFVPSLDITTSSRGWIGYAILLIHASVLVFGFFLNAVQTLIEVFARLAGAGESDKAGGTTRGGLNKVFGVRQLSRRMPRRDNASRQSLSSDAAMLDADQKLLRLEQARSRSVSASSTMLLDRQGRNDSRLSRNHDLSSPVYPDGHTSPGAVSTLSRQFSYHRGSISPSGVLSMHQVEPKDPYYREPRRNTVDMISPINQNRTSVTSDNFSKQRLRRVDADEDATAGASSAVPSAPPTVIRDDDEETPNELTKVKTDYAVREVDFYYGVRGPALSSGTRKLKTGPADPTGPVSSATGWFRGLFGVKTKEKGKGFEVVRSARAPPPGLMPPMQDSGSRTPEPYHDDPDGAYPSRTDSPGKRHEHHRSTDAPSPFDDSDLNTIHKAPSLPPTLPSIETGSDIELPSRIGSQKSHVSKTSAKAPTLPRKSSKRTPSQDAADKLGQPFPKARLSAVPQSPPSSPNMRRAHGRQPAGSIASGRLPFASSNAGQSSASPSRKKQYSARGGDSTDDEGDENVIPGAEGYQMLHHSRHSSSVLGAHAPDLRADRPSNVGFVTQHRASDNIRYSPDSPDFEGAKAEVLGGGGGGSDGGAG